MLKHMTKSDMQNASMFLAPGALIVAFGVGIIFKALGIHLLWAIPTILAIILPFVVEIYRFHIELDKKYPLRKERY